MMFKPKYFPWDVRDLAVDYEWKEISQLRFEKVSSKVTGSNVSLMVNVNTDSGFVTVQAVEEQGTLVLFSDTVLEFQALENVFALEDSIVKKFVNLHLHKIKSPALSEISSAPKLKEINGFDIIRDIMSKWDKAEKE